MTLPRANRITRRSSPLRRAGFTLIEASAVILIIGILGSLLCAALNKTKAKALRVTCLDNLKQLQHALWMYAGDNDDLLALNQTASRESRAPQGQTAIGSWVTGNPRHDTSTDSLKKGTLYAYLGNPSVYRCPMDDSTVVRRSDLLRTRSYAMNSYLGGDPELNPSPKYKFAQVSRPDNAFVFIEEHQESRWHSSFLVPLATSKKSISAASSSLWFSTPADRHAQGCNISFADGHIEYWRWYAPKSANVPGAHLSGTSNSPTLSESRDFQRLQNCLP